MAQAYLYFISKHGGDLGEVVQSKGGEVEEKRGQDGENKGMNMKHGVCVDSQSFRS